MMLAALEVDNDDPKTYKKAMKLPDAEAWKEACAAETQSVIDNKVEVVDRPNKKTVTSKWVLKKKRGFTGAVEKYKARIVAKGLTQKEGIDYAENFSPTVRFERIRIMLAEAASKDMQTTQMDVTTAFLYADF